MDKVDPTSWITLSDLAELIGWTSLERCCVEHVRPVLLARGGTCRVFTDLETTSVEQLIQCACVGGDDRRRFDDETRSAEAYTDVAFDSVELVEWMVQHGMEVPNKWGHHRITEATKEPIQANNKIMITLSKDELIELTDRKRGFAQHRVLQSMRIPSKIRADGAVVVLRSDLLASNDNKLKPKAQPNFDALG